MSKYQSIAVIYGSDSSEWEVSCRSGEFTASRIDEFRYDVYEIFARFGDWKLVAMRKANSMRQAFPEGAQPVVDKSDFSDMVLACSRAIWKCSKSRIPPAAPSSPPSPSISIPARVTCEEQIL